MDAMDSGSGSGQPEQPSFITLTCQSCDLTTTQSFGARRRTVCPHCGNFYHQPQTSPGTPVVVPGGSLRPVRNHRHQRHPRNVSNTERLPHLDGHNVSYCLTLIRVSCSSLSSEFYFTGASFWNFPLIPQ